VSKIIIKYYINVDSFIAHLNELLQNYKVSVFLATYLHDKWFANIYNFVAIAKYFTNINRVSKLAF